MESCSCRQSKLVQYAMSLVKLALILSIPAILLGKAVWANAEHLSRECRSFDLPVEVEETYWSADGQHIVFQLDGQDLEIVTWDIDTPITQIVQDLAVYEIPLQWSNEHSEISWHPDGDKVAFVDGQTVKVQDIEENLLYDRPATGAVWSFDGAYLAIQSFEERFRIRLQIWDMSSGEIYWELDDLSGPVWHPHKNAFAMPGEWGTEDNPILGIQIYDVDSQTTVTNLPLTESYLEHTDIISLDNLIWSGDGELIIADFDMQPILPVAWRIDTQQMIDISLPLGAYWDISDNYLAFKPVSLDTSEDQVIIWDMTLDQQITSFSVNIPLEIDWNPTGDMLAVRSYSEIYLCEFVG